MHTHLLPTNSLLVSINSNYMDICLDQCFCYPQASTLHKEQRIKIACVEKKTN